METATTITTTTKQAISGPRALPLVSWRAGMVQLYIRPFSYLRHMHDTYGDIVALDRHDPSYLLAFGPEYNFRMLSNPDLFQVMDDNGRLVKIPRGTALARLTFNNLTRMNGEHHRQQRRLMMPAFHKKQIVAYYNDMVSLTQQMLERWQPGNEINLLAEMQRLTQEVAVKTLFGLNDQAELQRLSGLLQRLFKVMTIGALIPIDLPGLPYRQAVNLSERFDAAIRAIIERKRSQPEATDVMASLVHVYDEDGGKLSDDELIGHAFTLYVAGHETTANALTWTMYLLGQHPQCYNDLLDELDAKLHGEAPAIEQLSQLPLLEGVVKEGLRLMPPALIGLREASEECELGGFPIAKGTNIVYSQFITHRLPELYAEPDRFKPERWLTLDRSPYEFLPFSAGHHMCIAASFAMQELKIVVAMMAQRYRLALLPNAKLDTDLTMRAKHGMPMRIFPQDRQFQRVPVRGNVARVIELV